MSANQLNKKLMLLCSLVLVGALTACGGGEQSSGTAPAAADEAAGVLALSVSEAPVPELESFAALESSTEFQYIVADASLADAGSFNALAENGLGAESPRMQALATTVSSEVNTAATDLLIYVSTDGNDAWSGAFAQTNSGRTDGPLKTIAAAQTVARARLAAMRTGSQSWRRVRVLIGPGEYSLSAPLVFNARDSGAPSYPMAYEAVSPGTVVFSGAAALGGRVAAAAGSVIQFAAPSALGSAPLNAGGQLYVNGKRAVLARQPNAGRYWFVQRPVALDSESDAQRGKQAFVPTAEALAWMNGLSAADRARAVVEVMQSWTSAQQRFSTEATPAGTVRLSPASKWAFKFFGPDQRYFVENVAAALDAPGEWLLDSSGVKYLARVSEAGQQVSAYMPVLSQLMSVTGQFNTNAWVEYLQFRGITFAYSRYAVPEGGLADGQAASQIGAAIEVNVARNIVFDGCTVTHTGAHGIWFKDKVRNSQITNSVFSDLGAGAIRIGLVNQSPTDTTATGGNTVNNNVVTGTGQIWPGAVAVWLGQTFDNTVSQNTITDTTYSAISVGWRWGYGGATSGRNRIQNNLMVNIGQGVLSDLGAIYTLGESPGTVISGNVIREVRGYNAYGAGAWGLYNDEGTSGVVMENNIVVGTDSGGYHLHYGRNNTLRNNLLMGGDNAEVRISKSEPGKTKLTVVDNLLLPKSRTPFAYFAAAPDANFSGNVVGRSVAKASVDLSKCGAGCAESSSASATLSADSKSVQVIGANATQAAVWAALAGRAGAQGLGTAVPTVANALPALATPTASVTTLDVAGTAIGQAPLGFKYIPADAIKVVAREGAPGGRCLQFDDGPQHANRWEPYAFTKLNHTTGISSTEFTLQIDSTTNFMHEWRDDASEYLTGPSLRVNATGVYVAGKKVAAVSVGEWVTLRVEAALGDQAGTWKLTVTDSKGKATVADRLPVSRAGWRAFKWVGLVSDASGVSRPCIGSFQANNTAQ